MQQEIFKYRIKLTKYGELKYISHLDWQNLIIKTLRRCSLSLVVTEGFNKIPKTSFSPALPLFIESECELVYFQTHRALPQNFKEIFEKNTNKNVKLIECLDLSKTQTKLPALETLIQWAKYEAKVVLNKNESILNFKELEYNTNKCLSCDKILIERKTKKGLNKVINYRKSLDFLEFKDGVVSFVLKCGQDPIIPSFRADEFLKTVYGDDSKFDVKRVCFFDKNLRVI